MASRVFLAGPPGVGKTTAIVRVLALLRDRGVRVAGFYTEEVREGKDRIGFDLITVEGHRRRLARRGHDSPAVVGSYGVFVQNVDMACEHVEALLDPLGAGDVVVLDEIGPMELCSKRFESLVERVLDSPRSLVATLKSYEHPFVARVLASSESESITLTRANRGAAPERVVHLLLGPPSA